jgi:hypothetical protein
MKSVNIKSSAPYDIEQIVDLIKLCEQSRGSEKSTYDHLDDILDDVLFGRHSCLKALVARYNMQVVGCLFYQHYFSITECRHDVQEVHCYVLENMNAEHVKQELRAKLKTPTMILKPRRREFVKLNKQSPTTEQPTRQTCS